MSQPPMPLATPPHQHAEPAAPSGRSLIRAWLQTRAGAGWQWTLGLVILLLPIWLWFDPLDNYRPQVDGLSGLVARVGQLAVPFGGPQLIGDDYAYLAEGRTLADLKANLWVPHNSHVVPLFRAWTFGWSQVAGTLAGVAATLTWASIGTFLAATLLIGWLVGRETGRPPLGLASMAVFGISAILEETVRWYSAGQAIGAGICLLAMLISLQGWRSRGGAWRLGVAAGWAVAAPLVWTVGLIAGPVGFVYLWADGRPRARMAAIVPLMAGLAVAALVFGLAGREVTAAKNFHGRDLRAAADPVQGIVSTAQATVEVFVLGNLGLAAETTPAQAFALLILLAAGWARTRGRPWTPNPLEAAGAAIVVLGGIIVYTARGYYPYEQLRNLHWYQAVPEMGAILCGAGWWAGRGAGLATARRGSTWGELLVVLGGVMVMLTLQTPRARDNLVNSVVPLTGSERLRFPIPTLRRLRAHYLRDEYARWQRRYLARLDQAEAQARTAGWGRAAIRAAVGGPAGPQLMLGVNKDHGIDPVGLLALPEIGPTGSPDSISAALLPLLTPPPERPPPWLNPDDRWPPAATDAQ